MKICFYTHGHIGDLLLTLPFVDLLIRKYPNNEYYQSVHGSGVRFHNSLIECVDNLIPCDEICGDINIPTWMCSPEYSDWVAPSDYCFDNQFTVMKFYWSKIYSKHGFDIKIPDNLGLDYKVKIDDKSKELIDLFGKSENEKIIIFNQKVKSNQTDNDDCKSYLVRLSNLFPNYDFLYTNEEDVDSNLILNNNLYYTPDIFGNHECDIIHNFYLSKYCKVLVGKTGGPFMFSSMHNDNVQDSRKVIISQHEDNPHRSDLATIYNRGICKSKNIHTKNTKQTFTELENILCQ